MVTSRAFGFMVRFTLSGVTLGWRFGSFPRFLTYLAIFSFSWVGLVQAEALRIFGVEFQVNKIRKLANNQVELTLGAETTLVTAGKLEEYVIDYYFGNKDRVSQLPLTSIGEFVTNSVKAQSIRFSALGLRAYVLHPSVSEDSLLSLLATIRLSDIAIRVFQLVLQTDDLIFFNRKLTAELLVECGISDSGWVDTLARRYSLLLGEDVWQIFSEHLNDAFVGEDYGDFDRLIKFAQSFFRSDPGKLESVNRLNESVLRAKQLVESGDIDGVNKLISGGAAEDLNQKALKQVINPLIAKALHQAAREKILEGDLVEALTLLAKVDFKRRTPTTHKLVLSALQSIGDKFQQANSDLKIQLLLRAIAKKDGEVARVYLQSLSKLFAQALQVYDYQRAEDVLEDILELRGDPNAENDQLRVEFILAYLRAGHYVLAKSRLSEITTDLPISLKLRLALSGVYFDQRLIFLVICLVILALLLLFRSRRNSQGTTSKETTDSTSNNPRSGFKINPKKGNDLFRYALSERQRKEYLAAIQLLGLAPGASLEEIKTAFRNAVKTSHPDVNPEAEPVASEKFVSLTAAYEKLLDLEKERENAENSDDAASDV